MSADENTRVFVLWWGGSSYGMWEGTNDLESFPTLDHARDALCERYELGYWQRQDFPYVNKSPDSQLCPSVGEDSEMWLFYSDPTQGEGDLYPDAVIKLSVSEDNEATAVVEPC
jgi:hypothetical protein